MGRNAGISTADPSVAGGAARDNHDRQPETDEADVPMTIGEVAREFGMTQRALRFYEAKQLLTPRRQGAVRLYRRDDRERIMLILAGRRLGFTLAEIREIVGGRQAKGLHLTREQCVTQINLLEQQKRGIEIAIAELRQIYTSFYKRLLEEDESRLASPKHTCRTRRSTQ